MSWRSLFAIANPTGRIGSQYTATLNTSAIQGQALGSAIDGLPGVQNLATFSSLPIGVYSISISFNMLSDTTTLPDPEPDTAYINGWVIGAGTANNTSTLSPITSIVPLQTIYNAPLVPTTNPVSANFIISVTNSNSIYINSSCLSVYNTEFKFQTTANLNLVCVATKLA